MAEFECKRCGETFEVADYFWGRIGDDVTCPHCGAVNTTEYDEGDDSCWAATTGVRPDPKTDTTT